MKKGKTITEIAAEIQRQSEAKRDFVADTSKLEALTEGDGQVVLAGLNGDPMPINDLGHEQIGLKLGIPKNYYERMRGENPELLAKNINGWFKHSPKRMLVRTLDHRVRSFLTEGYRPLDNLGFAGALFPAIADLGLEVVSADITERRFYLKVINQKFSEEIGEEVQFGKGHRISSTILAAGGASNSEVGNGKLKLDSGVHDRWCDNLNFGFGKSVIQKVHVGRKITSEIDELEMAYEMYTDQTREADDKAFFLKVRDAFRGMWTEERFATMIAQIKGASAKPIVSDDLPQVVEVTRKKFGLGEELGASILKHLAQRGDLSQWGLASAITQAAGNVESYDDATDLERLGGKVIELAPSEWKLISEAKKAA